MTAVRLHGLHGTNGASVDAVLFSRAETAPRLLQYHRAITAKGPLGRINVWWDVNGFLRAERMYFSRVQASTHFSEVQQTEAWLRENLPFIGKAAA